MYLGNLIIFMEISLSITVHHSVEIRKSEEQIFSKTLGQHLKVIDAGTVVYIFLVK